MNNLPPPLNAIVDLITSSMPLVRAISILLTAFFLAKTFDYAKKSGWFSATVHGAEEAVANVKPQPHHSLKAWKRVVAYANSGDENGMKLAVIEADKILDEILRAMGISGQTLSDRLSQVTRAQFPYLDDVWAAHKLRNKIAHEPNFALTREMAASTLKIYERAFRDFGIIE